MENTIKKDGPSQQVIKDYHKRTNEDYKNLSNSDKNIIDEIDRLLKILSKKGKDYWDSYYS